MTAADHYDAVKAQLEAGEAMSDRVRDTIQVSLDGTLVRDSYVVLFGGSPDHLDDLRVTKVPDPAATATYVYTVRSVSTTPGGVRSVFDKVLRQLLGVTVSVTGRRCDPIRLTHSTGVQADDSVKPPLYFEDDEFTLVSRRP